MDAELEKRLKLITQGIGRLEKGYSDHTGLIEEMLEEHLTQLKRIETMLRDIAYRLGEPP